MKLLFSEARSDYANYIFPYAIWAFPEKGEKTAAIFSRGFLPSSSQLDRFYLCRQIRVDLSQFKPSSENRRILRKGAGISVTLIPRKDFELTTQRRDFYKNYTDIKYGRDVMTHERLEKLFQSKIVSHILLLIDESTQSEVGIVTLYLESPSLSYYYYAFYDLNYYPRNLGMYMMTSAVEMLARKGFQHLYLGTCYSANALYKAQFLGSEFFNGFTWSTNLKELKYLIERDQNPVTRHLLETEDYLEKFHNANLPKLIQGSTFKIQLDDETV